MTSHRNDGIMNLEVEMKGLEAKLREWGEDPGEVVSGDFTRIELHAAFDRVKNKNN